MTDFGNFRRVSQSWVDTGGWQTYPTSKPELKGDAPRIDPWKDMAHQPIPMADGALTEDEESRKIQKIWQQGNPHRSVGQPAAGSNWLTKQPVYSFRLANHLHFRPDEIDKDIHRLTKISMDLKEYYDIADKAHWLYTHRAHDASTCPNEVHDNSCRVHDTAYCDEEDHSKCPGSLLSYGGKKLHVVSTTPQHVARLDEILDPIIEKHAMGSKKANPQMLQILGMPEHEHQAGKGKVIYLPDHKLWQAHTNEIVDALKAARYPVHGRIIGDTMVSPSVGIRQEFDPEQMAATGGERNIHSSEEYHQFYVYNPKTTEDDLGILQQLRQERADRKRKAFGGFRLIADANGTPYSDPFRSISPGGQESPPASTETFSDTGVNGDMAATKLSPWNHMGDNGIEVYPSPMGEDGMLAKFIRGFQQVKMVPGPPMNVNRIGRVAQKARQTVPPIILHIGEQHGGDIMTMLQNPDAPYEQWHSIQPHLTHNPEVQIVAKKANILDPIHESLDPDVFLNADSGYPILKPELAQWVKKAVYDVFEKHGYANSPDWIRLILTGSLTTMQWSPDSDFDISLWVDLDNLEDFDRAQFVKIVIDSLDGTIVPGTTHPLQCFVVDVQKIRKMREIYQPGLRSAWDIDNAEWVVPPEKERSHDVKHEMKDSYHRALQAAEKMKLMLDYEPERAKVYWHYIHAKRRKDMLQGQGDYADSNIVYKMLSNSGLFPRIEQVTGEHIASKAVPLAQQATNPDDISSPVGISNQLVDDIEGKVLAERPEAGNEYGLPAKEFLTEAYKTYVGEGDNCYHKETGKPFYAGVVDMIDGKVIHTVPYKRAEAANFHHSDYLPDHIWQNMNGGDDNLKLFWMADGEPTGWEHIPAHIKGSIKEQVSDIEWEQKKRDDAKSFEFNPSAVRKTPPRSWSRAGNLQYVPSFYLDDDGIAYYTIKAILPDYNTRQASAMNNSMEDYEINKFRQLPGEVGQFSWVDIPDYKVESESVEVHPDFRRQGIASALIREAKKISPDIQASRYITEEGLRFLGGTTLLNPADDVNLVHLEPRYSQAPDIDSALYICNRGHESTKNPDETCDECQKLIAQILTSEEAQTQALSTGVDERMEALPVPVGEFNE